MRGSDDVPHPKLHRRSSCSTSSDSFVGRTVGACDKTNSDINMLIFRILLRTRTHTETRGQSYLVLAAASSWQTREPLGSWHHPRMNFGLKQLNNEETNNRRTVFDQTR